MARFGSSNGADALVATLEELGAECVFGVPGTQNVVLFESLRRSDIRTVLATSEASAGFMANGWFRASGRPGIFVGIPGPGFAWSLPPLVEAVHDSAAVLMITSKPRNRGYKFDLQAFDQRGVASALDCLVIDVDEPDAIQELVRLAWRETTQDGPRPVILQVAQNAFEKKPTEQVGTPVAAELSDEVDSRIDEIRAALRQATRPIVMAGAGTLHYADRLDRFVEHTGSAFFTTPTARGVVAETHPMCLPVDFVCDKAALINDFLSSADLIIALGCRFSHNGSGGFRLELEERKLVHVDIDREVLQANYRARWSVNMDAGQFIDAIMREPPNETSTFTSDWSPTELEEFRSRIRSERNTVKCEPVWKDHGDCLTLFQEIRSGTPKNAAVVLDTGLHQILARSYLESLCPCGLIFPSDFQSMGFGLPAAIGAALSDKSRPVVALIGDGSFLMVSAELLTARREGLSLPLLVFCDGTLGQIRMQQLETFGHETATELESINLEDFASSLNIEYALAGGDLSQQLEASFTRGCPTLIEVRLEDGPRLNEMRNWTRAKNATKAALGSDVVRIIKKFSR